MNLSDEEDPERRIFGVPTVITRKEIDILQKDLGLAWLNCYGRPTRSLEADIELARKFFDPIARGQTLRQRLAELSELPTAVLARLQRYGDPLVVTAGDGVALVGIEARILLDLLSSAHLGEILIISDSEAASAEHRALETYRRWSRSRLQQVIDLRSGTGREVMQAVAVGVVLALLVIRSDHPDRAVVQWDSASPDGRDVDQAIYGVAEEFARTITPRAGRSSSEKRLKGGYGLTEARRRLAHRLVVERDPSVGGARIYIPAEYRNDVIEFVAHDLARRPQLSAEQLDRAFDRLVSSVRDSTGALAHRTMTFERPIDTDLLREKLLREFDRSRHGSF